MRALLSDICSWPIASCIEPSKINDTYQADKSMLSHL